MIFCKGFVVIDLDEVFVEILVIVELVFDLLIIVMEKVVVMVGYCLLCLV